MYIERAAFLVSIGLALWIGWIARAIVDGAQGWPVLFY